MGRKRNRSSGLNKFSDRNLITNQKSGNNPYYEHYSQYLQLLAFQLFEWKGLPESVDPSYLERVLTTNGFIGFYKDSKLGYIVCRGAIGGRFDNYELPTTFRATTPNYNKEFKLYNYRDIKENNMGVLIRNNDIGASTLPSLDMFAEEITEIKHIIRVNQNAQKTPVVFLSSDKNLLTMKTVAEKFEGNEPFMFIDEKLDVNMIKAFPNVAPFIVDKMNTQKNAVWNECMTYLGIKNANLEKKERMVTSEVDSNDEQINSSGNVFLKARQEACKKINELYGLNISVDYRESIDTTLIDNDLGGGKNESNNSIKKSD